MLLKFCNFPYYVNYDLENWIKGLFFYLFLKDVQINYLFSDNVHILFIYQRNILLIYYLYIQEKKYLTFLLF